MERESLIGFVERLDRARTLDECSEVIVDIADACDCSNYLTYFGTLSHDARTFPGTMFQEQPLCIHNFPQAWADVYYSQMLFRIDPVMLRCLHSVVPVFWHLELRGADEEGRRFFAMAREHGLAAGLTIPIHARHGSFGSFALCFDNDAAETLQHIEDIAPDLHVLSFHVYANLRRIASVDAPAPALPRLTPREKQVLLWTASGKTIWEISVILSISQRTAKQHLSSVMAKLGVENKFHAVAEAVACGLTKAY